MSASPGALDVPEHRIAKAKVVAEQKRLAAVILARRQIKRMKDDAAHDAVTEEMSFLFDAYLQMLDDSRLIRGAMAQIAGDRINAEAAVQAQLNTIIQAFQAMDNAYIAARVDDVRDVGNRIIRNLMREPLKPFSQAPDGAVIIADQLSPADTAQLDPSRIAGAVTTLGGAEGHAAIMARALGIPLVLGIADIIGRVQTGDSVIIDGTRGWWFSIRPNEHWRFTGNLNPTRPRRRKNWATCGPCRRSPATASRSPFRPTWNCPLKWTWSNATGRRASACCAPNSCT